MLCINKGMVFLTMRNKSLVFKLFSVILAIAIIISSLSLYFLDKNRMAYANIVNYSLNQPISLPYPKLSKIDYRSCLMRGIEIDKNDPLKIKFYFDSANKVEINKKDINRMIKYFLGFLTIPKEDLWVNLSPYEKDRIIPESLMRLDIGKDMLLEDYILKKIISYLTNPHTVYGKKYWQKIKQVAYKIFKINKINIDNFYKIWIIPGEVKVYKKENKFFIQKAQLKVMMDDDYQIMKNNNCLAGNKNLKGSLQFKETFKKEIMPVIEQQVNNSLDFVPLRQLYYALIISDYFKENFKNHIIYSDYIDRENVQSIELKQAGDIKKNIYTSYLNIFNDNKYYYSDKEYSPYYQKNIKYKYFSGGLLLNQEKNQEQADRIDPRDFVTVNTQVAVTENDDYYHEQEKDSDSWIKAIIKSKNFFVGVSLITSASLGLIFGLEAFILTFNLINFTGIVAALQNIVGIEDREIIYYLNELEDLPAAASYPTASIVVPFYQEPFEVIVKTMNQAIRVVDFYNQKAKAKKANFIVFDDGLQTPGLDSQEKDKRIKFYRENGIAYIARPPNNKEGFYRTGFFKKASNLNYAHNLDVLVQKELSKYKDKEIPSEETISQIIKTLSNQKEYNNLRLDLSQIHGNITTGDFILFLDNDSFAPTESLVYSIHSLLRRPQVGYIQHASSPLNPEENLLTKIHAVSGRVFWKFVLKVRSLYAPAPILGHNLVIRKEALAKAYKIINAEYPEQLGPWHEGRGADDLVAGMSIRRAGYYGISADLPYPSGEDFKEGLALTYSELAGQMRRYGSTATGSILTSIKEWKEDGLLRKEYKDILKRKDISLGEKFELFLWAVPGLQGVGVWFVLGGYFLQSLVGINYFGLAIFVGLMTAVIGNTIIILSSWSKIKVKNYFGRFKFILLSPLLYVGLWLYFSLGMFVDLFLGRVSIYRTTMIQTSSLDSFSVKIKKTLKNSIPLLLAGSFFLIWSGLLILQIEYSINLLSILAFNIFMATALFSSPFIFGDIWPKASDQIKDNKVNDKPNSNDLSVVEGDKDKAVLENKGGIDFAQTSKINIGRLSNKSTLWEGIITKTNDLHHQRKTDKTAESFAINIIKIEKEYVCLKP